MSEGSPTRSRLIALKDERRAMQEGYVFLDEKCLLLAAAMLAEVRRHDALAAAFDAARRVAARCLDAALARHGIDGLSVYPALHGAGVEVNVVRAALLGVALRRVEARPTTAKAPPAVFPSPEGEACRAAFVELAAAGARLAAVAGNLARLLHEYRRTVRRACALHDVVLPELDRDLAEIDSHLDELERDEALWVRFSRRG